MSKTTRMIFASVGLLSVAFALLLTERASADEDDAKAEKAIKALGGRVERNSDAPGKPIVRVYLTGKQVTDVGLKELAGLKNLQTLDLRHTKVTDAGLKEIAGLKSLQFLLLNDTQVTDAGLKQVAALKSLQFLHLFYTNVTDAGVKELAGLKRLRWLSLSDTQVTDAGVAELRKALPKCKIIR
jgi:internalin A